jgi:transaldolase/glucose-6-phosphate isomerase
MSDNPLIKLKKFGQSIWYDNIRRALLTSGELAELMEDYGVTGITSNPVIFEKAISGGAEYDADIERLAGDGRDASGILTELTTEDIRLAADILRPVFDSTGGRDGFVSIEVSPKLAYDAAGTIEEARHLHSLVGRPNILIKVPATKEGIAAVEELVYQGYNINVTLLFSVKRYAQAAEAYIDGLERRLKEGKSIKGKTGVASFFVSRVDTLIDNIIEERVEHAASHDDKARLQDLAGKIAVANAKLAFVKHSDIFGSERYLHLKESGAGPQKLLWASTGTKNPLYSDIKYVENLIGEDTINTMPLQTLLAFREHGAVAPTLATVLKEAEEAFTELEALGIDYAKAAQKLEDDGVKNFEEGFDALVSCISAKKEALVKGPTAQVELSLGQYEGAFKEAVKRLEAANFPMRLDSKDPTLWKDDPQDKKLIKNSLGWLVLPEEMGALQDNLKKFAEEVRVSGITDVVLLGMGGSSLAPLVLAESLGLVEGFPTLHVLDSTDPEAVDAIGGRITAENAGKFLFIVSSKSGTTIEPLSLFEYFYKKLSAHLGDKAGSGFIAITDPGTALEGFSRKFRFRHLFTNPPDIGGRFSALSYFGLVPAAIAGIDIEKLLSNALKIKAAVDPCVPAAENPGVVLGAALGALAASGRDKVTFFVSDEIKSFGLWIEQLVAESTGKDGLGIVPISGEPALDPAGYGADRLFVNISIGDDTDPSRLDALLDALKGAGHPVIKFHLKDAHELGGEFFRWEVATAAAGVILGINPFDQPDVELAKKLTVSLLDSRGEGGRPTPEGVEIRDGGLKAFFNDSAKKRLEGSAPFKGGELKGAVRDFLAILDSARATTSEYSRTSTRLTPP